MPEPPDRAPDPDHARWTALAARVFRPDRARLAACLASLTSAPLASCERALRDRAGDPLRELAHEFAAARPGEYAGIVEPREAWETVAPPAWLGDAARAFETRPGAGWTDTPASLRAVLALAADPTGVQTAEELAREAGHRLAVLTAGTPPARVVWRVVDPRAFVAEFVVAQRRGASAGERALLQLAPGPPPAALLERALRAAALVEEGGRARVGAGGAWAAAATVRWHVLARDESAARDPFAPMVGIWELGYALDRFAHDAVVLAAPLV